MLLKGFIYAYKYNGEILYIGSTENKEQRHRQHLKSFESKTPMGFHNKMKQDNLTFDDVELEYLEEIEFDLRKLA